MMKPKLILLFSVIFLFSCSSKNKVPGAIMQPDKMRDVLWDVMRVQFLVEEVSALDSSLNKEKELNKLTEKVFKIHKITSVKFDKSYDWYIKHPELFKTLLDSIQVQKQRIQNGPQITDSSNSKPIRNRLKGKENEVFKEDIEQPVLF